MPESVEIKGLIDRLGRQIQEAPRPENPFEVEYSPLTISICISRRAWPGNDYILIGRAYHSDWQIIGSEFTNRRSGCFTLMLEKSQARHRCVCLPHALDYEGFLEVLSDAERQWLLSLPENTLLGPFYGGDGCRQRSNLAVWKFCSPVSLRKEELSLIT